ncbi:MAG TPA: histidine kinase dimerization/phosphoacceptor domain -containing protein [Allosphingosinicella sp.]|nr:histidine kinase dimerization/phosphoacceptor domain -containing protein [Allosphingosinicella sp.]
MSGEEPPERLSRWDRLSTGLKMWIILSVGLLPLGIVAIIASIDNARASRDKADVEARALLAEQVQRFTLALSRNAAVIRTARDSILESPDPAGICRRTLDRLSRLPNTPGRFALFGQGARPTCWTEGFSPSPAPPARGERGRVTIRPGGEILDVFLYDPTGALEGVAEYRRDVLARVAGTPPLSGDFEVALVQGDRVMSLRPMRAGGAGGREIAAEAPFAGNQYSLRVRTAAAPTSLSGVVGMLTPVLMWLWASVVGWILVQRLLLFPLGRIQNVIAAYRPGERPLDLPTLRTPAHEIGALGRAFSRVTETVARHEAELEAAVVRQTRLVREVHHRVKNNLQVVASLLNLHARGAASEEVAAAYASIQRRVDALAVVHRNHYAELEDNRGVALKPLISELAANLRATAPASAAGMQIRLDVAPFYAGQDVAVSVAFLVTEIAEFGMLCGASLASIALDADAPGSARLSIEVDALAGAINCDAALEERFDRIVAGLARQLRSTLEREPARGLYAVRIALADTPTA